MHFLRFLSEASSRYGPLAALIRGAGDETPDGTGCPVAVLGPYAVAPTSTSLSGGRVRLSYARRHKPPVEHQPVQRPKCTEGSLHEAALSLLGSWANNCGLSRPAMPPPAGRRTWPTTSCPTDEDSEED